MPNFTTTDGVSLYYQDWGSGPPAVFLSALGLSSKMWQHQTIALADHGIRCVAYDRRGHGRSDDPGHGYDYDTLAGDLAALLDLLGLSEVTLVGASMACGEIVRYLTLFGDERVARIAFIAPAGPFPLRALDNPNGVEPVAAEALLGSWKRDFASWVDSSIDDYIGKGLAGCEVSGALVEWARQDLLQVSLRAEIECQRTALETDQRPEMAQVALPTLIVDGDHDMSIPTELSGQVCAALIRDSVLKLYENAPHGLHLTHRDRLNHDLIGFIQESALDDTGAGRRGERRL